MLEAGLPEEVKTLYEYRHLRPLQTVGYSEFFDQFEGKLTPEEAIVKFKQHTRNYAKRQMTWFKKDGDIRWIKSEDIRDFISKLA
jgi:tRNA dimethylallyltransferase